MTHQSGVFTAYYARKRGSSGDGLTRFRNTCFKLQEKVTATHPLRQLLASNVSQVTTSRNTCLLLHKHTGSKAENKINRVIHFTQNHHLHPISTTILVCCFSAAAEKPDGRKGGYLLSHSLRDERDSPELTYLFSFNTGRVFVHYSR